MGIGKLTGKFVPQVSKCEKAALLELSGSYKFCEKDVLQKYSLTGTDRGRCGFLSLAVNHCPLPVHKLFCNCYEANFPGFLVVQTTI